MNVGDEKSLSCWMDSGPRIEAQRLESDHRCDVAIVGGGIAGLSTAYELSTAGRSVALIDRGRIGWGMTARTTAHLATALDDFYFELIRVRGEEEARLYLAASQAAVDRIEAICSAEKIDCGFARVDGFLIPTEEGPIADLEEEYEACRSIGLAVEWAERAPMPGFDSGRCLRFPNQARFHPLQYLAGLASAIERRGGRLFSDTAYVGDEESDAGVELKTEAGFVLRCSEAVFATNSPVNNKVQIHPKQKPDRTYVIAGRVAKGSVPDALVWDTLENYHYVRIEPIDGDHDLLIVGGEDHRSGEADDADERLGRLSEWTRKRYPSFSRADYSWSGQVLEPIDFMPYSGRNPGSERLYVHTGDSGQGMTNGVAGSLAISAQILGRPCNFAETLDPARKSAKGPAAMEFIRGQAGAAKNLAEHLGPGEIGSTDELRPGEGAIVRRGLSKVAAYRAPDGQLIERSAVCTHAGCIVHWNGFERCWDCPCHGSQFATDGQVLNGPAVKPLAEVEPAE